MKNLILSVGFCILIMLTGCGGGIGLPGVDGLSTATELNNKGWEEFNNKNFALAEEYFVKTFDRVPSTIEKAEANTGIGWCKAKLTGIRTGQIYFEKGSQHYSAAKMGLAGAYLSNTNQKDYERAVELLEEIGLSSLDFIYKEDHDIGVTNAEAHALLGTLYYYTGNEGAAEAQIRRAKEIDDNVTSCVDQIADQFITN